MTVTLMLVSCLLAFMAVVVGRAAMSHRLESAETPPVRESEPGPRKTHSPEWEWYDEDGNRKYYPAEPAEGYEEERDVVAEAICA